MPEEERCNIFEDEGTHGDSEYVLLVTSSEYEVLPLVGWNVELIKTLDEGVILISMKIITIVGHATELETDILICE